MEGSPGIHKPLSPLAGPTAEDRAATGHPVCLPETPGEKGTGPAVVQELQDYQELMEKLQREVRSGWGWGAATGRGAGNCRASRGGTQG